MPSKPGSRGEERTLRRAYLVAVAVPFVLVSAIWLLAGAASPFLRVTLPAVAGYLGLLLAALWLHLVPVGRVGPLVLACPLAVVFARLVAWRTGALPAVGDLGDPVSVGVWLAVAFPLAFLVLGTRRGVVLSAVVYLAFTALTVDAALAALVGDETDPAAVVALALTAMYPVLIALTWVLASRREHLAAARARGDLLAELATTDPLTGLANRRQLDDALDRMAAEAKRYHQPLSVVLVDLDHFKAVNDEHGHEMGDLVLVEAAARLAGAVRAADLAGRWGGEEFLVICPHTDHRAAWTLAERCRHAIAEAAVADIEVTASLGVATLDATDDVRSLVRRADLALYAAKSAGRDRVAGADDDPALDVT